MCVLLDGCRVRWQRSKGSFFQLGPSFTLDAVADKFDEINDFDNRAVRTRTSLTR